MSVQLRSGLSENVRVTVTWELPETIEVSRNVSGGVALEIPVTINLVRFIAFDFPNAPTLPRTMLDINTPGFWVVALSAVLVAGLEPQLSKAELTKIGNVIFSMICFLRIIFSPPGNAKPKSLHYRTIKQITKFFWRLIFTKTHLNNRT